MNGHLDCHSERSIPTYPRFGAYFLLFARTIILLDVTLVSSLSPTATVFYIFDETDPKKLIEQFSFSFALFAYTCVAS